MHRVAGLREGCSRDQPSYNWAEEWYSKLMVLDLNISLCIYYSIHISMAVKILFYFIFQLLDVVLCIVVPQDGAGSLLMI